MLKMEQLQNIEISGDYGYFGWEFYPVKKKKHEEPSAPLQWSDIAKRLKVEEKPRFLTDLDTLNEELESKEGVKLSDKQINRRKNQIIVFWEYPFSIPPVLACHVAKQRGCSLENVDFLIHGGILGVLSRCKTVAKQETILVQNIGDNIINIRIIVDKNGFLGDAGHQFERLVVGDSIFTKHNLMQHQHLRLMQIGIFRILVYAEADAISPATSKPVEIKTKNVLKEKAYDRDKLKILLQMISNGSDTLITADREKHADQSFTIKTIETYTLKDLVESLTEGADYVNRKIDDINNRLKWIKEEMNARDKSCFELKVTSESMDLQPLTTESRAKNTQHSYQVLNSEFYSSHVCSDAQFADAMSIESRS